MPASQRPDQRIDYSAIVDRPPLKLPGGARLVIWPVLALEHWDISRPMPRTVLSPPMGQPLLPDVPNWSWHEYGMRVGFWRLKALFERYGISPTVTLNGRVCLDYPRVAAACRDNGWEFNAHAFEQIPMHKLGDQRDAIRRTVDVIGDFAGRAPRGWFGPGLTQTYETLDLLAEAGIAYIGDMVLDDQPVTIRTTSAPIVALPYNFEIHDISMMMIQHHASDIYLKRAVDSFQWLYEEAAESARVMAFAVHPYISGVPHRIGAIRDMLDHITGKPGVVIWNGEQILDWYLAAGAGHTARA